MAGLVTVAPILATVWVVTVLFNFFDGFAAPLIDPFLPFHIPGLGVIIGLLFMYLLGILVTNFLGRKLVSIGEALLRRIPLASTIYGTAKQITQSVSGASSRAFQKAVLIQLPPCRSLDYRLCHRRIERRERDGVLPPVRSHHAKSDVGRDGLDSPK